MANSTQERSNPAAVELNPNGTFTRRLPIGAEVQPGGGVHFRVWAANASKVDVVLASGSIYPLAAERGGYFGGLAAEAAAGTRYRFRLDEGEAFPDPASRCQPDGVHDSSQVVDPAAFRWTDDSWQGLQLPGQAIYEMHIGTFTPEGTWRAASDRLSVLAELGITVLEVMPIAEFPGAFGWGYDGVALFAPYSRYGTPDDCRAFVDRAHALKLAVILDVVYNHLGPDGNYLGKYSSSYFSQKHSTDWGAALNFDSVQSAPVREFYTSNARYWIGEFHMDGLRLDATQDIHDDSETHVLAEVALAVRQAAGGRDTILIAENEPQLTDLVRPQEQGGIGLDGLWNDDFHHSAMVRLSGSRGAYYHDYLGNSPEFIAAAKYGYLYQGQFYSWQSQRRGTPSRGLPPSAFISFIGNHDQIANSARGLRLTRLASANAVRTMTALLILMPGTPMLFQGQEFAATTPFLYFADHKPELAKLIRQGRREFFDQWRNLTLRSMDRCFADPGVRETFERCKLNWSERDSHGEWFDLHRDLFRLRRTEPAFQQNVRGALDGAVLSSDAFVLRFFGPRHDTDDRLLVVNFGADILTPVMPEPLFAPPAGHDWRVLWSSEDPSYGGCGQPEVETSEGWFLPGLAAVVLQPDVRRPMPVRPKAKGTK